MSTILLRYLLIALLLGGCSTMVLMQGDPAERTVICRLRVGAQGGVEVIAALL